MLALAIPGFGDLELEHLVLDYNGTLAVDGSLIPGVRDALLALSDRLAVHVVTADTFGRAGGELAGLPVKLTIIPIQAQAEAKLAYVQQLGARRVCAVGNGRNDGKMLAAAALGIAVMQSEGVAGDALAAAAVVAGGILDALDLLRRPLRLIATLRA